MVCEEPPFLFCCGSDGCRGAAKTLSTIRSQRALKLSIGFTLVTRFRVIGSWQKSRERKGAREKKETEKKSKKRSDEATIKQRRSKYLVKKNRKKTEVVEKQLPGIRHDVNIILVVRDAKKVRERCERDRDSSARGAEAGAPHTTYLVVGEEREAAGSDGNAQLVGRDTIASKKF